MLCCVLLTETLQVSMFFELSVQVHENVSLIHVGPAQVPMMSPNGSVPTIYVPPGYAPQVCHFVSFLFCLFA